MQAVILASGRGVRMGALTEQCPKPMLPLLGKPLLAWKVEMLPPEIDEVIFVVGYLREKIEDYFGSEWQGRKISHIHQETLDGTAQATLLVKEKVQGRFFVMNGDDLYHPGDLRDMMREELAVLGLHVTDAEKYGLLEKDAQGNGVKITERPHGKKDGIVNTGAYVLDQRYFQYPPVKYSETEYGLPQTVATMSHDVPVKVCMARAWQPIGCPEDIAQGEAFLKKYWNV